MSVGGSNPSGTVVLSGSSNVPVLQIQFTNTAATPVTITSLQVPVSGGAGVVSVSLTNGASTLGTGAPSGGTAVINLGSPIALGPNQTGDYILNVSFAPTASGNFNVSLGSSNVTAVFSNGLANVTGSATSNTFVVEQATSTPLPTATETITPTLTPVTQVVISAPYPNPSEGGPYQMGHLYPVF
jgi:hypothetical protein